MINKSETSRAKPWSITTLNHWAARHLESRFAQIWVKGEISNLASARYGHRYFSLKDAKGQIACIWFLGQQKGNNVVLKEGLEVVVRGTVSLYGPRGTYQLQIDCLEEAGVGALQQAFEALKKKLMAKGWFDEVHKKTLPRYPTTLGIITSLQAAALQDVLSVLKKRYPVARVLIYPAVVQGNEAPASLVRAIGQAVEHNKADVLLLTRGGGSLEDLWAFNEEIVAEAIFNCPIPIVSGVGHEVDTTISDWVADVRSPTPSAAAERIVPDRVELLQTLDLQVRHIEEMMQRTLRQKRLHLEVMARRCRHPGERLVLQRARLMGLWHRLQPLAIDRHRLLDQRLQALHQRLDQNADKRLQVAREGLLRALHRLEGIGPMATLKRGYAKVAIEGQKQPLRKAEDANVGDPLLVQLAHGALVAKVDEILP